MRWDRTERLGAAVYLVASGALAALTLTGGGTEWCFELARAMDAAGRYLFFAVPLLLALCVLSAQRRAALFRELAPVLPQPLLGARSTWIAFTRAACLVHTAVILAVALVAWRHEAYAVLSYQPIVRQYATIIAAGAAGALVGSRARSIAVPGALLGVTLFAAVLVPATGLRDYLLAGVGTFDFSFQRYSVALIALGVLMAVGMVLPVLPWPTASARLVRVRLVVANVVLAGAVVLLVAVRPFSLVSAQRVTACQEQSPRVCGPASLDRALMTAADAVTNVLRALPPGARQEVPPRLTLLQEGGHQPRKDAVDFDTSMHGRPGAVQRSVIATVTGEGACPADLPPPILETHVLGSATLAGWLQSRLGVTLPGSFPADLESRLAALPAPRQDEIVVDLMKQVWSCGAVDLSAIS